MAIVTKTNLDHLFKGFNKHFQNAFKGAETQWPSIAMKVPSSTQTETYAWLNEVPKLREWIGDRVLNDISADGYQITNKHFEGSIGVGRDEIEDDRHGIYVPMVQELGYSAATFPDELVFGLLKEGFKQTCFDGQNFFDTDHPIGPDRANPTSLVSNVQDGNGSPWFLLDTSRAIKPLIYQERKPAKLVAMTKEDDEAVFMSNKFRYGVDLRANAGFGFWQMAWASKADLTPDNFKKGRLAMKSLKSDQERPLGIAPRLLVVGSSNQDAAEELLKKERLSNGATNVLRGCVDLLVSAWLD